MMENKDYTIEDLCKEHGIEIKNEYEINEEHIKESCSELGIEIGGVVQENADWAFPNQRPLIWTEKETYGEIQNIDKEVDFKLVLSPILITKTFGEYRILKGSDVIDIYPFAGPGSSVDKNTKLLNAKLENNKKWKYTPFNEWFNFAEKYYSKSDRKDWVKNTGWAWLTSTAKQGMKIFAEIHWVEYLPTKETYARKIKSWASETIRGVNQFGDEVPKRLIGLNNERWIPIQQTNVNKQQAQVQNQQQSAQVQSPTITVNNQPRPSRLNTNVNTAPTNVSKQSTQAPTIPTKSPTVAVNNKPAVTVNNQPRPSRLNNQ